MATADGIDKLTSEGNNHLLNNDVTNAVENFKQAYEISTDLNDPFTKRSCAFNYGAGLVANKNPTDGLKYLHEALPPRNNFDGASNGDLFYNFGLA